MKCFVVINVLNGKNRIPVTTLDELEILTERLDRSGATYNLDYVSAEAQD